MAVEYYLHHCKYGIVNSFSWKFQKKTSGFFKSSRRGLEVKGNESNEVTQKVNSLYIYFHFFFLCKSVFFALPSLPYHLSSLFSVV